MTQNWLTDFSLKFKMSSECIYEYFFLSRCIRNSPGKIFRKFPWVIPRIYEISNFIQNHRFWKNYPENPLSHSPKSLKSVLEKFSGKSPESFPGFFDRVSFELKFQYQVRYEVCRDIMSRCTNPSLVDATWSLSIIVRSDVTIQQNIFFGKIFRKIPWVIPRKFAYMG